MILSLSMIGESLNAGEKKHNYSISLETSGDRDVCYTALTRHDQTETVLSAICCTCTRRYSDHEHNASPKGRSHRTICSVVCVHNVYTWQKLQSVAMN